MKLSTIVERSPLYRFLDQSRAALLKIQPSWQDWYQRKLPQLSESAAHLSAYDATTSTITISTDNASTAALIKHQKNNLIKALSTEKSIQIKHIKVRIDLVSTSAAAELHKQIAIKHEAQTRQPVAPNTHAIDSVQRLQNSVKNPDLADTLGDLAETLKKLSSDANNKP